MADDKECYKVYVGSLNFNTRDHDLERFFAECGTVVDGKIYFVCLAMASRFFSFQAQTIAIFVFPDFYTDAHLKSPVFLSIICTGFSVRWTEYFVLLRFLNITVLMYQSNRSFDIPPPQVSKFIFAFGSTCATRCKFLGTLPKF